MENDKRNIRRVKLAKDILELAARQGWKKNHHLTEIGLSEALGVSRSPVRMALRQLEEWGAVVVRPNLGVFLQEDAAQLLALRKEEPLSTEDMLYKELLQARLEGRIIEPVTQSGLMNQFGRARAVVEQVLNRMQDEGIVQRLRGKGWVFEPQFESLQSSHMGYEFRLLLEPAQFALDAFTVDARLLAECRAEHEQLLSALKTEGARLGRSTYETDARFHEMLAGFSGNRFILQAIQHQNRLRRTLEYHGYVKRTRVLEWCGEHIAILDALAADDRARAASLMRSHLQNADHLAEEFG
ncbi:FCD domain-containing protein [Roseovarius mucosus]|uniref:FCD domain-containing protein n=1 Tax=Roseovarius mucosus TaxID=215743 RepID=UPI003F71570B